MPNRRSASCLPSGSEKFCGKLLPGREKSASCLLFSRKPAPCPPHFGSRNTAATNDLGAPREACSAAPGAENHVVDTHNLTLAIKKACRCPPLLPRTRQHSPPTQRSFSRHRLRNLAPTVFPSFSCSRTNAESDDDQVAVADQPQKPKVSKLKLMSASSTNPRLGDAITEAVREAYQQLPEGVTPSFMKVLLSSSYCSGDEASQVEDVPEIRLDDLGQVVTPMGLTNVIDVIARLFAKVCLSSFPPNHFSLPFPPPAPQLTNTLVAPTRSSAWLKNCVDLSMITLSFSFSYPQIPTLNLNT